MSLKNHPKRKIELVVEFEIDDIDEEDLDNGVYEMENVVRDLYPKAYSIFSEVLSDEEGG
jgi:hypothetical protein